MYLAIRDVLNVGDSALWNCLVSNSKVYMIDYEEDRMDSQVPNDFNDWSKNLCSRAFSSKNFTRFETALGVGAKGRVSVLLQNEWRDTENTLREHGASLNDDKVKVIHKVLSIQ